MEKEKHAGGRPKKFNNAEELQEAIEKYFKECDKTCRPYTMSGLACALDVDRRTLINYEKLEQYEELFLPIKYAKRKVEAYAEEKLFGTNVTGVIFNLKNNFKWQDKNELAIGNDDKGELKVNLSNYSVEELKEIIKKENNNENN